LSAAILPGVTRQRLLALARKAQISIVERRFTPCEAQAAAEAFLTAATAAAIPIVAIDGVVVGTGKPGPLTRKLAELYAQNS
jgi:D-alanine transaminase